MLQDLWFFPSKTTQRRYNDLAFRMKSEIVFIKYEKYSYISIYYYWSRNIYFILFRLFIEVFFVYFVMLLQFIFYFCGCIMKISLFDKSIYLQILHGKKYLSAEKAYIDPKKLNLYGAENMQRDKQERNSNLKCIYVLIISSFILYSTSKVQENKLMYLCLFLLSM